MGTYPPRECGIATFTQDLANAVDTAGSGVIDVKVIAMNAPGQKINYPPEVISTINHESTEDFVKAAFLVNSMKNVACVSLQHEYGIYGPIWGEKVLEFLKHVTKPVITTLHTVLSEPDKLMKDVTQAIITHSNKVVVMTNHSKELILQTYICDEDKILVIPHGIHFVPFVDPEVGKQKIGFEGAITLSTFGLLSRGKGIEYVIESLPPVVKKYPNVKYLLIGETHPVVKRKEGGDFYRDELKEQVKKLKLEEHVVFVDKYLEVKELLDYLKATDIYVSTSLNPEQSVSGTFSYAIGTGRAIVSTRFAQAKEFVTPDIGKTVEFKSPEAYTKAFLEMLANFDKLQGMHEKAYRKTRHMVWENVGRDYLDILLKEFYSEKSLYYRNVITQTAKQFPRLFAFLIGAAMVQWVTNKA